MSIFHSRIVANTVLNLIINFCGQALVILCRENNIARKPIYHSLINVNSTVASTECTGVH